MPRVFIRPKNVALIVEDRLVYFFLQLVFPLRKDGIYVCSTQISKDLIIE